MPKIVLDSKEAINRDQRLREFYETIDRIGDAVFWDMLTDEGKKGLREYQNTVLRNSGNYNFTNAPKPKDHDPVNHPTHYNSHPSGVECITITEHMTFNVGNAIKHLWPAGLKGETGSSKHIEDLNKAAWYINREIRKLEPVSVFVSIPPGGGCSGNS